MPSARVTLVRHPERGSHDASSIAAVLDEGLICHVAFVVDGEPVVLPTTYARVGDHIYIHGSVVSRMMNAAASSAPISVNVTLTDGLVLARSAFHHSMNYRSVSIFGVARRVEDADEKTRALEALVNHVVPGRSVACRPPSEKELKATMVLALSLADASLKSRSGPPIDAEPDYQLEHWAGVIPMAMTAGDPRSDPKLDESIQPGPDVAELPPRRLIRADEIGDVER